MAAKKGAAHPKDDKYTNPALRERLKEKIIAGDKGGRAGQWSARKAQLLAHEYEAAGGGYTEGGRKPEQKSLHQWTAEKWKTASGGQAIQGNETHRYLPEAAWNKLTAAQKKATDKKKVNASKKATQFVANTSAAKKVTKAVRKKAVKSASTKKTVAKKTTARKTTAKNR